MSWWRYPLAVLLWVWTFPIGLGWLVNRRSRVGTLIDLDADVEVPVHEVRWWLGGFSTAFWPGVLLSERRAASLRRKLDEQGGITRADLSWSDLELCLHERRHLQQQAVFGPLFLPLYGLSFLILWAIKRDWYAAYMAIPFEADARAWAAKRIAKGGVGVRR